MLEVGQLTPRVHPDTEPNSKDIVTKTIMQTIAVDL